MFRYRRLPVCRRSVVRPAKIATIDPARIVRRLGVLDRVTAEQVARRVAAFLG